MRGRSIAFLVLFVIVVVPHAACFSSPRLQAGVEENPAEQNKKVSETLAFLMTMPPEDTEEDRETWNFIISRMFVTPEAEPYLAKMADVEPYSATWLEQLSKAINVTREKTEQDTKALEEQVNNDPKLEELIESSSAAFDPQWNERPGPFEAHLRCRHESPIFPPSRRRITLSELEQARTKDQAAFAHLNSSFEDFLLEMSSSPPQLRALQIDGLRITIDELIDEAATVGAPATDIQARLERIRSSLMEARFAGLSDPDGIHLLRQAEVAYEARARLTHNPNLARLRVIPADDLVPTLLTLHRDEIELFLLTLDEKTRDQLAIEAERLVREMRSRGQNMPGVNARLATLKVLRVDGHTEIFR